MQQCKCTVTHATCFAYATVMSCIQNGVLSGAISLIVVTCLQVQGVNGRADGAVVAVWCMHHNSMKLSPTSIESQWYAVPCCLLHVCRCKESMAVLTGLSVLAGSCTESARMQLCFLPDSAVPCCLLHACRHKESMAVLTGLFVLAGSCTISASMR
jgi:exosortase/archaeosortase